ncbi:hypothetical protein BCR33DRAFT_844746 [Rhizoclosmatium globosum]|uniref:Pre-rRNA-processing protein RIX1 N-terminal domain-containing protein n=1 Tax=Rhizoclosmatium globosum TaxID=329046 RepID=A0A1Y2D291_9FUNG|nr:hypothetical protein BCR33DRAFT_844746 [Rhizoclosmatium globosum]|eukprot:ORY53408.1 hypothetical protein BCR33DRAFT_844746 [Rhizoclosmatium globosum]
MSVSQLVQLLGADGIPPTLTQLRTFVSAATSNPALLASLSKAEAALLVAKANKFAGNQKCNESLFVGAVMIRLLAANEVLLVEYAASWCNLLMSGAIKKSAGPLFDEALLTLRCLLVRSKQFAHLQRDVVTPTLQKLFVLLLQKVAASSPIAGQSEILVHTLNEYTILGSTFPSIAKPYTDKIETLCIQTLSTDNLVPRVYTHAIKALVVVNRILNAKARGGNSDGSGKPELQATAGRISETLLSIVKELLSVVYMNDSQHQSKSQPYTLPDLDGSYAMKLSPLLDRFKAFVQAHLYILTSRPTDAKHDTINHHTVLLITSQILSVAGSEKPRNGHHEQMYADRLATVMPVLVTYTARLLGALLNSLGPQAVAERESVWFLVRKVVAYSAGRGSVVRVSAWRLVDVFVGVYGVGGVDVVYKGIVEDLVADVVSVSAVGGVKMGRGECAVVVAAAKTLTSVLTYTTPQHLSSGSLTALFTTVVQTLLAVDASPRAFGKSIQIALSTLLVKCLQCHGRDAFPYEWVSMGLRALVELASRADLEVKPKIEALLNAHSDVLFGYRPVFGRADGGGLDADADREQGIKGVGYGSISTTGNSGGFMEFIAARRDEPVAPVAKPIVAHILGSSSISATIPVKSSSRAVSPVRSVKSADEFSTRATDGGSPRRGGSPTRASSAGSSRGEVEKKEERVEALVAPQKAVKPVSFTREVEDDMEVEEEKPVNSVKHTFVMPDEAEGDADIELPDIVIEEEDEESDEEEDDVDDGN